MARPRKHKSPTKLNISLGSGAKRLVLRHAFERGESVGDMLVRLVAQEQKFPPLHFNRPLDERTRRQA